MIRLSPIQIAIVIAAALLLAFIGFKIYDYGQSQYRAGQANVQAKWDKSREKGMAELARLRAEAGKITVKTETVYVDRIKTIREKGNAIIREVPVFVSADDGGLSGGFRLFHDAAAAGTIPDPADIPDAAPVDAQTVASTIASNYTTHHETAQRLISLQDWVIAQCKANPPPEGCTP